MTLLEELLKNADSMSSFSTNRLSNGTVLKTPTGEDVTVISFINEGGQGDVYKVRYKNDEYALKWYNKDIKDVIGGEQYNIISALCPLDAPSDKFIWPLTTVARNTNFDKHDMFGYVMNLLPNHYHEMSNFLLGDDKAGRRRFKSYHAWVTAGLNIVAAIRELHLIGLSYKDLQPKNFAFDEENGDIRVIDNDNVSAQGSSVLGTIPYMAPEILRSNGKIAPNTETDFYSLAIVLFQLFYNDHPMDGKRLSAYHVINPDVEKELYGKYPVFSEDPMDSSNRPCKAFSPNVLNRWDLLFTELHDSFIKSFTAGIEHPEKRLSENSWMTVLSGLRDSIVKVNGREYFIDFESEPKYIPKFCLKLDVYANKAYQNSVAIHPSTVVFENSITGVQLNYNKKYAVIGVSKETKMPMIMNTSENTWKITGPGSDKELLLKPSERISIRPGMKFEFSDRLTGILVNPRQK